MSYEDESILIEKLASNQMNKGKALKLALIQHPSTLNNVITKFSNIVGNQNRWWLEPHNEKFKEQLNIILHNHRTGILYIFQLPAITIANPETVFNQRNDKYRKDCSDIYIPVANLKFEDIKGFDFTKYLVQKIGY